MVIATGSESSERFGSLQLALGGKHGYTGVRGSQGKQRNKFQAYANINGKKKAVPGLFNTAHEAAVALAQSNTYRTLGFEDEPDEPKPRAKRDSKRREEPHAAANWHCCQLPRLALSQLSPMQLHASPHALPITAVAMPLPQGMPADAYRMPIAYSRMRNTCTVRYECRRLDGCDYM